MLDKLIHPSWAHLPGNDENQNAEDIQSALERGPDDPMSYDFRYDILEADDNGRQPMNKDGQKFVPNPEFDQKSVSCLRRIADSVSENKVWKFVKLYELCLTAIGLKLYIIIIIL